MGEIARRVILRLAEEGGLFGKRVPAGLKCKNSLTTPQMGKIDHDTSTDMLRTADILQEAFGLDVDQITLDSTQVVSHKIYRKICVWLACDTMHSHELLPQTRSVRLNGERILPLAAEEHTMHDA